MTLDQLIHQYREAEQHRQHANEQALAEKRRIVQAIVDLLGSNTAAAEALGISKQRVGKILQ